MNSLSASRFLFEFILFFRIHYLFCEFTLNPRTFSNHYDFDIKSLWIHYLLNAFTRNSSSFSQILYDVTICVVIFLWIHYFFPNSLWIHYLLRYINMNSLSISRIHLESTIFCVTTMISLFLIFFANWLSVSQILYKFTICFVIFLWIRYFSRIHF